MFLGGLFFEWIQTVLILAGYVSGNATFPKPLNKSEEKKYLDLYAKGDESAKNDTYRTQSQTCCTHCKKVC